MKKHNHLQRLILFLVITFTLSNYMSNEDTQISQENQEYVSKIELLYYSGIENPSIKLTQKQQNEFLSDLLSNYHFNSTSYNKLGYDGFLYTNSTSEFKIKSSYKYEMLLLSLFETLNPEPEQKPEFYKQIKGNIYKNNLSKKLKTDSTCLKEEFKCEISANSTSCCPGLSCIYGGFGTYSGFAYRCTKVEIDKETIYNCNNKPPVEHDNCTEFDYKKNQNGCFIKNKDYNNCYNYATNVLTNTYAQPGRGSTGKMVKNTCNELIKAAVSDGLKFIGRNIPKENPKKGHFAVLLASKEENGGYHWVRRDCNLLWSHKIGPNPPVNVDDKGKYIRDIKLPFGGLDDLCGYFHVIPSEVNIN